jgi:hypothetical protein
MNSGFLNDKKHAVFLKEHYVFQKVQQSRMDLMDNWTKNRPNWLTSKNFSLNFTCFSHKFMEIFS